MDQSVDNNVTTYSAFAGIIISNVEELKAFRDAVNNGTSFAGKTVKLAADIDLSGEENWEPIGNVAAYPGKAFKGTFDGAGHTISHLTIDDQTVNWGRAALFGSASNATIKNLNITDVDIKSHHYASAIVAYKGDGTNVTIENCHVKNGSIVSTPELLSSGSYDNGDKVGAILGYGANPTTIDGCSAENINISGYRDLGSIAGFIGGTVTNCTAKDVTIVQDNTNGYKDGDMLATCGEIVGGRSTNAATVNAESSYDNVVITQTGLVAQIGTVKYRTLAAAVAAVPADGTETTITMIDNETIVGNAGVTIPTTKNVKLDLNGKAVTLSVTESKGSQLITNQGVLTITDSSEGQEGKLTNAAADGLAVGSWPTNNYVTNIITNSGTLNVEGGNIVSTANGSICYAVDNNSTSYDATLNIKGGYLTSVGTVVRQFCNSTTKQNVVNVSGGTIETNGSAAIWTQLPGSSASSKKLATLNITGGVVKATSYAWYDYSYGDSFEAVNYSISGGELYGSLYSYAVKNGVISDFVSGGLFSKPVGAYYLADGLICATSEEYPGMYELVPAEIYYSWMSNGQEVGEYYAFAYPIVNNNLEDGEFITLLKDVTLTEDIACQLAEGSFKLTLGDYTITKGDYSVSLKPNVSVLTDKQTDIFSAAEAGYMIEEAEVEDGFTYTAVKVEVAAPIVFHDGGTYEEALTVPMIAQAGAEIYYSTDGTNFTKYAQPIEISATTTVTAYATMLGAESKKVEKTFTIVTKQAGPSVTDGFYNIKTNGDKYVNVAGRKTVTLVENADGMPGTVIRVKATDGKVETLRSQGVDVPSYATRALNYVDKFVKLGVEKLDLQDLLGHNGTESILTKFHESFDANLYLEEAAEGYRIYGRTPSMKHVVDFYQEHQAEVDYKLPQLEQAVNNAINKVVDKVGRGQSLKNSFSIHEVWERMGSTLTEPVDEVSTAQFYTEVLTSESNIWKFAYETAMKYVEIVESKQEFQELKNEYEEYFKYYEMAKRVRPDFKYYIVPSESGVDFISEGNIAITDNDPSAAWTMEPVSEFKAKFDVEQSHTVYSTQGGVQAEYKEYYTTLYTDFAYTLPEGVKAYKVKEISDKGVAVREEIEGTIPAQTPVLLKATFDEVPTENQTKVLTLTTEAGTAPTDNLLKGNEYLINKYEIKAPQVEKVFGLVHDLFGDAYDRYVKEYEYLMLKYAGTVGNKYFFGLSGDDLAEVTENLCQLATDEEGTAFIFNLEKADANKAFLVSDSFDRVLLTLKGDVDRDGKISIGDVTALVNIILGKATYPKDNDKYDFEAAEVDGDKKISIADVTKLVNIILGKE